MKMVEVKKNKEKLPFNLITTYINQGWQMIEQINADKEAVKSEFSNNKIFIECLEDLSDTYLIMVGRLQKLLTDGNYIDMPEEVTEEAPKKAATPDKMTEDLTINIRDDGSMSVAGNVDFRPNEPIQEPVVEPTVDNIEVEPTPVELPAAKIDTTINQPTAKVQKPINVEDNFTLDDEDDDDEEESKDDFDWDIEDDFPTPDFSQPKITDDDLYKDLYEKHKQ